MAKRSWEDLAARTASGLAMVAVGLVVIWAGGLWIKLAFALVAGGMIWELVRLLSPDAPGAALQMAGVAGLALLGAVYLPGVYAVPLLLAPAMAGLSFVPRNRVIFGVFTVLILAAAFGMVRLRVESGALWLLWLVAIVVTTDVAGYFAGRLIGGPKFWPRVSPKKTWSGTIAGWIGAAIVGFVFVPFCGIGLSLVGLSIAISMASQMGDMAESAMKRRVGAKDSSTLIPGHGGLLDRFDGMLGGSIFLLLISPWAGLPVLAP